MRFVTDAELVGPEPVRMFTLLQISHSVCEDTGMDNSTLAMTLELCATRCLLAVRGGSGRSCSHFAWLPKLQRCAIYQSCNARVPFAHQARLYEKSKSTCSNTFAATPLRSPPHHECPQMSYTSERSVKASAWRTRSTLGCLNITHATSRRDFKSGCTILLQTASSSSRI